jgi:hypothetical protein
MQPKWLNNGEPDESGDYVAVIENAAGLRISTFKGKSYKEVADKVLESQANANREISRLRRPDQARVPQQLKTETKTLTPADKLRLATDITDPDKVVDAVTEIVTAAQDGVTPRQAINSVATMTKDQRDAYYQAEAQAFVEATPDYYPVPQNQQKLFAALEFNNYDLTRNNLAIVFQMLFDQGQMIPWPEEGESNGAPAAPNGQQREAQPSPEPNPPSPTSRPRSVSTGIRSSDASASPPPPPAPKKITRADIERMPRREYMDRINNDPAFRKAVDALGA